VRVLRAVTLASVTEETVPLDEVRVPEDLEELWEDVDPVESVDLEVELPVELEAVEAETVDAVVYEPDDPVDRETEDGWVTDEEEDEVET